MSVKLFNGDCLEEMKKIDSKSIDLIVVDLPYGETGCEWDTKINLSKMWEQIERIIRNKSVNIIFFTSTRFGVDLINSNPKVFRYDLIWEKSKKVGFLAAKKIPLRKHEMIYIFRYPSDNNDDSKIKNKFLRDYFKNMVKFISKSKAQIVKEIGGVVSHCIHYTALQFSLPTQKTYNLLIDKYKIDKMDEYLTLEELKKQWIPINDNKSIYNPIMEVGKPYTTKRNPSGVISVYGTKRKSGIVNKGTRYPNSVLKFNNPKKSIHPTQKPVDLCAWLIKTYSNEGGTILDFTMGSGSTGVGAIQNNRNFIGIEKDETIFKMAKERIEKEKKIES